jgi:hypothetical protein
MSALLNSKADKPNELSSQGMRSKVISVALAAVVVITPLIAVIRHSCGQAQETADDVMKPLFPEGWYRSSTKLRPFKGKDQALHLAWRISYAEPSQWVCFPPTFWIGLDGHTFLVDPSGLRAKIEKHISQSHQPFDRTR